MSSAPLPHQHISDTSATDGSIALAGHFTNVAIATRKSSPPPKPFFAVPFRPDPDFIDRGDLLSRVEERCSQPAGRVALVGLGGVGKSQIAIEHTYRTRERLPDTWIFWVHASNAARFEQGYRDITDVVKIARREDPKANIFKLVHDWLRGQSSKASRATPAAKLFDLFEITFLKAKTARSLSRRDVETAYISQRLPRYSVRQYIENFQKSDRKKTNLLNYEGGQLRRDWEAQNSIIIIWQISFEYIRRTRPSAASLLSLMSFFDRQSIPEALVRYRAASDYGQRRLEEAHKRKDGEGKEEEEEENASASGCSEDERVEKDLLVLKDYSFLSVGIDGSFEMHALVQLATRKWLEAYGQLEAWKQCYIKNLSAKFPTGEYKNWIYCQALFPHAKSAVTQQPKGDGSLREWASLLHNAAWYAWRKGSITEAVDLSNIAMKVRKKILGQEHRETLGSMDIEKAEELQVRVMETKKRVLGEEHPSTLTGMANLASTYWNQGRWKEAEELQVRVIETRKRVLGEEHPDTLNNFALILKEQGEDEKAIALMVECVGKRKQVLSRDHPITKESEDTLNR